MDFTAYLSRYFFGVSPYMDWNADVKWLCEENSKYSDISDML